MKYVDDDSTTFWAIGRNSSVLAAHAEHCGKEVFMVVPFEGIDSTEVLFFTSCCNITNHIWLSIIHTKTYIHNRDKR